MKNRLLTKLLLVVLLLLITISPRLFTFANTELHFSHGAEEIIGSGDAETSIRIPTTDHDAKETIGSADAETGLWINPTSDDRVEIIGSGDAETSIQIVTAEEMIGAGDAPTAIVVQDEPLPMSKFFTPTHVLH